MLSVNNISISYGTNEILRQVSFTCDDGTMHAIVGPNGSGKTTLLRCIAGLQVPQAGAVLLDGKPVTDMGARQLAQHMALVRQQAQADLDFSAFEIVLMGRNPYQRHLQNESQHDWDIVEECMRKTNTWHLRLAHPSQMSGGELQRVMIARALAQQTPLLLLDEPTSNLDIAHQFDIMRLLADINRTEHKTILIVLHDLNLAMRYCPQTLILFNHTLLFHGNTDQALTPDRIHTAFNVHATNLNGHLKFER